MPYEEFMRGVVSIFTAMIITVILRPAFVFAEVSEAEGPLSLKAVMAAAKANSTSVQEAQQKVHEMQYQKYLRSSTLYPKLDLNAKSMNQKDSVANRPAGSVPFDGDSYNNYNLEFRLEQPLLAYGLFSGVGEAEQEYEISKADLEVAERELTKKTIRVFYRTLMTENLISILQEQEGVITDLKKIAEQRLQVGGRKTDYLQVKTQLALMRPKIENAKSDLAASVAELSMLIGKSNSAELRLRAKIPSISLLEIEKQLSLKEPSLPEIQRIRLRKEKLQSEKDVALGKNLPNLKLIGTYGYANYTQSELLEPESQSWSVQLNLNVPLFSGLSSVFERRALSAKGVQLEMQERRTVDDVRLSQIQSRKTLESADAALASAEEAVKLAHDSRVEARREYRYGIIDFLQFLQVESSNFEASTSLLQLRVNAINAYVDYFAASGQSLAVLVGLLEKAGEQ